MFCILYYILTSGLQTSYQRWAVPNTVPNSEHANMFGFVIPVRCTEFETSVINIVRISNVRNTYSSPNIDLPNTKIFPKKNRFKIVF